MKFDFKIFMMMLTSILVGCTSQIEVDVECELLDIDAVGYLNVPDTSSVVSESTAKTVASAFAASPNSRMGEADIENVLSIYDSKGSVVAYAVNYAEKRGFVVVSASKQYMPVLAYSSEGCFTADGIYNTGIKDWIDRVAFNQENTDSIPQNLKIAWASQWTEYTSAEKPLQQSRVTSEAQTLIRIATSKWRSQGYTVYSLKDYKQTSAYKSLSYADQCAIDEAAWHATSEYGDREEVCFMLIGQEDKASSVYGNQLQTTWGQGSNTSNSDYNMFVPNLTYLGCATVAVGQLMKYHQWPKKYDWSSMPNSQALYTTAKFLYELGVSLGIDYKNGKTGASIDDACRVLIENGYSSVVKKDFDSSLICSNVNVNRPVYVRATDRISNDGHAWICDACRYHDVFIGKKLMVLPSGTIDLQKAENSFTKEWEDGATTINAYLHMNWGWDGRHNGFYEGVSWNVAGYDLSKSVKMLYNIYPVK